ncbi:MAG: hypothetical protein K8U57_18435 [Planctomycetes bacterium]|nr:hypothetical protein [Planctomycetota bacterium]
MLVTCPHCTNQMTVSAEIAASGALQCPHCDNILSLAMPAARPARAARATAPPATDAEEKEAKSLSSCLGCFVLVVACCVVFGVIQQRNQKLALEEIAAGDKFYAEGKKAEAVAKYKSGFSHAPADRKAEIIKRSADIEAEAGHTTESRYWVEQGLTANLDITYSNPTAREVLATVKRERADVEAQRVAAEAKKKEERAAKEQARRDAEAKQKRYGDEVEATSAAQIFVKRNVTFPDEAKFGSAGRLATQKGDGSWIVLGQVTSKNAFGVKSTYKYAAALVRLENGNWREIETVFSDE